MAVSLEAAQAKYARKTQNAAGKWKSNTTGAGPRLQEGLRRIGASPGPEFMSAWQAGVNAAEYRPGDPNKWRENFLRGVSR